jgi:hypothetical protein
MIKLFLIPAMIFLSCGSTKTNQSAAKADSTDIMKAPDFNKGDSTIVTTPTESLLPTCIKNKIDSFKLKEAHERPQRVVEYMYKGKKVYYVVMPCCDFFNEVYDENCKYLGAPDGGFTGRGDGKLPDFTETAKPGKEVWKSAK